MIPNEAFKGGTVVDVEGDNGGGVFSNTPPVGIGVNNVAVSGYSPNMNFNYNQNQNAQQYVYTQPIVQQNYNFQQSQPQVVSVAKQVLTQKTTLPLVNESDDPYKTGFVESYDVGINNPTQNIDPKKNESQQEKKEEGKKVVYSNPLVSQIILPEAVQQENTNTFVTPPNTDSMDIIQEPMEVDGEIQPREYLTSLADGAVNVIEPDFEGTQVDLEEQDNPNFGKKPGDLDRCRFCSSGESTGDLIAPCRCDGKMTWSHRKCLDRWRVMSIHASSFSRCDHCSFKYEFENGGRKCPSIFAFCKCSCLICCDFSLLCCCWTMIITFSSLLTWAAFGDDGLENFLIFALLPDLWIFDLIRYVVFGHIWIFIILGVIAICVFAVSMVFRCQKTRSKDFHYYGRYRSLRLTWFDYFCLWYMVHMGMCDCNSLYLLGGIDACALSILACGVGACRTKGGAGKSNGIEQLMLVVLLFVLCSLLTIGIVFGSIFLAYLTYVIISRRIRIVMRADRVKKNVVVDQTKRVEGDDVGVFTLDDDDEEEEGDGNNPQGMMMMVVDEDLAPAMNDDHEEFDVAEHQQHHHHQQGIVQEEVIEMS